MPRTLPAHIRTLTIAAPLLLLNACAHFNTGSDDKAPECPPAPKTISKFDNLLAFAVDTGTMPPPARAELCRGLVKRQKDSPDHNNLMQLLVARTLSDSCGDIGKLLEQATTIPASAYDDDKLKQFVGLQIEVLRHQQFIGKRLGSLEKKKKKLLGDKDVSETGNNETRLLREKLDAIRSMEKRLDGGGDSK